MILKPRLQVIYELIDSAHHVVDVGADHAYLSIALIKNNKSHRVSNIEVNPEPLKNGISNVNRFSLQDKIDFYLNDGLLNLNFSQTIDFLCISGMGADNIIHILETNKNNIIGKYILQPNCDVEKLRQYLFNNNYEIIDEKIVLDNNHYYEVIVCCKLIIFNRHKYDDIDVYIGPIIRTKTDLLTHNYLLDKANYLNRIYHINMSEKMKRNIDIINKFFYEKKWIS